MAALHASKRALAAASTPAPRHVIVPARPLCSAVHAAVSTRQPQVAGRKSFAVCRATLAVPAAQSITPLPTVKIDNVSDPFATVVTVEYGEQLGELLDTITALKNLRMNILRAKLVQKTGALPRNVFYITDLDTSEKILRSARLEEIRMVVINSLVASYPESASSLTFQVSEPNSKPLGLFRKVVPTTIDIEESATGTCSVLKITTPDRPGLLVDIVRSLKDISLNVVSAEIDTVGTQAVDEFFLTYHGEPLNSSMVLLVTNALQYYLSFSEVAENDSY